MIQNDNTRKIFLKKIRWIPYSKLIHFEAKKKILNDNDSQVDRALTFYTNIMMSYGRRIDSTFSFSKFHGNSEPRRYFKKIKNIAKAAARLRNAYIMNDNAVSLITKIDSDNILFYLDPPYPDTIKNYYHSFSMDEFEVLLNTLTKIKGKFLLSCYDNDMIIKFEQKFGWNRFVFEKRRISDSKNSGKNKQFCSESLVMNFLLNQEQ